MDANNMNSIDQLLKLNETLTTYNISLSVFMFVACVENNDLALSEISEMLDKSPAGMTTIRDTASDKKFIKEVVNGDRRKKVYAITDLGKELLASCRQ